MSKALSSLLLPAVIMNNKDKDKTGIDTVLVTLDLHSAAEQITTVLQFCLQPWVQVGRHWKEHLRLLCRLQGPGAL